jgi:hypothetical protein
MDTIYSTSNVDHIENLRCVWLWLSNFPLHWEYVCMLQIARVVFHRIEHTLPVLN